MPFVQLNLSILFTNLITQKNDKSQFLRIVLGIFPPPRLSQRDYDGLTLLIKLSITHHALSPENICTHTQITE
jgi:hypothetical protein